MDKQFYDRVEELFNSTVTAREEDAHSAQELLDILNWQDPCPNTTIWDDDKLRIIYDSVSIVVTTSPFATMTVFYLSNYTASFTDVHHCDTKQLAEFILALTHSIPQWEQHWMSDLTLRLDKSRISEIQRISIRNLRREITSDRNCISGEQKERLRQRFFRIKTRGQIPEVNQSPREDWSEEWTTFLEECEREKAEREKKREERQNMLMKKHHLIQMKYLKLKSLTKTLEFHPLLKVEVSEHFNKKRADATEFGFYRLGLTIGNVEIPIFINYDKVDIYATKYIEVIRKVNDLLSELEKSLIIESKGRNWSLVDRQTDFNYLITDTINFAIAEQKDNEVEIIMDNSLRCCQIAEEISDIINETLKLTHKNIQNGQKDLEAIMLLSLHGVRQII